MPIMPMPQAGPQTHVQTHDDSVCSLLARNAMTLVILGYPGHAQATSTICANTDWSFYLDPVPLRL